MPASTSGTSTSASARRRRGRRRHPQRCAPAPTCSCTRCDAAEAAERGLDCDSLAVREPRPRRVRRHAVRSERTVGRLPRRRPRAHGARRFDGGVRVRTPPTHRSPAGATRRGTTAPPTRAIAVLAARGGATAMATRATGPVHRRLGPRVLGVDDRVARDDLPVHRHADARGSRHPTVTAADGRHVAALMPDFLGPHVFTNLLGMLEATAWPVRSPIRRSPTRATAPATTARSDRAVKRLAETHDGDELFRLGQAAGLPWGVIRAPEEVLDDPHLAARGHFVELDGVTHRARCASGAPFIASASPFRFERPPPRLGEHTVEVIGGADRRGLRAASSGSGRPATRSGAALPTPPSIALALRGDPAAVDDAGLAHRRCRRSVLVRRRPQRRHLPRRGPRAARAPVCVDGVAPRRRRRCAAVANAAMAVETGQAEVVVVYRSLCQGQFHRFGAGTGRAARRRATARRASSAHRCSTPSAAFTMPFGMFNPPIAYAMVIQRHMHLYGTTCRALRQRRRARPRAYAQSQPAGRDARQADVARRPRGVAPGRRTVPALRLLPGERRRVRGGRHDRSAGSGSGQAGRRGSLATAQGDGRGFGHGQYVNVNLPDERLRVGGRRRRWRARLWARAGIGPADVDVAMVYDHFTGLVLLTLEDFGFCGRGEGGAVFAETSLPINTHGGSLSEAYIHGLTTSSKACASCGASRPRQVDGAEVCLVTSAAGVPTSALVLGPTDERAVVPGRDAVAGGVRRDAAVVAGGRRAPPRRAAVQRLRHHPSPARPAVPALPVPRRHVAGDSSGRGTVYTFTVVHQAFVPSPTVPYVVAAVDVGRRTHGEQHRRRRSRGRPRRHAGRSGVGGHGPRAGPAEVPARMKIGLFHDYPQADGGAYFEQGVRLGLGDAPHVDLVTCEAHGLPHGSEEEVATAFRDLVASGVDAVVGPSISDNGVIIGPIADELRIPCINYTGGERHPQRSGCSTTRSARWRRSRCCWRNTSRRAASRARRSCTTTRSSGTGTPRSSARHGHRDRASGTRRRPRRPT